MKAKMAAKNLKQMYFSSSVIHKNNGCVQSYYAKDVVSKYVEMRNNNCIISKMAANMAAKKFESSVSLFCNQMQRKMKCPVMWIKWRTQSLVMSELLQTVARLTRWQQKKAKLIYIRFKIFGGHLSRHLRKYAVFVIYFCIFLLYNLYFIWIDTLFVFVSERRAEIH